VAAKCDLSCARRTVLVVHNFPNRFKASCAAVTGAPVRQPEAQHHAIREPRFPNAAFMVDVVIKGGNPAHGRQFCADIVIGWV
jgi:hypothetical protein